MGEEERATKALFLCLKFERGATTWTAAAPIIGIPPMVLCVRTQMLRPSLL